MVPGSLYKNLFNRTPGEEGDYEELESVAQQFPFFSIAHFFLLKNAEESSVEYEKHVGKTALHFNNGHLLTWQLNKILRVTEAAHDNGTYLSPIPTPTDITVPEEQGAEPILDEIAGIDPIAAPVKKEELLFEPLHTTDYFASQGIKLSEELQPGDKLGKQLKSFTDWLKTMKKVHESRLPEGNEVHDAAVNKLAEKSNTEEEVLTEAMAEAFIQQGKKQKARDIYLKLSLLNPSKNAYFAAKLEQIN